jgi:hypothetical protein
MHCGQDGVRDIPRTEVTPGLPEDDPERISHEDGPTFTNLSSGATRQEQLVATEGRNPTDPLGPIQPAPDPPMLTDILAKVCSHFPISALRLY